MPVYLRSHAQHRIAQSVYSARASEVSGLCGWKAPLAGGKRSTHSRREPTIIARSPGLCADLAARAAKVSLGK